MEFSRLLRKPRKRKEAAFFRRGWDGRTRTCECQSQSLVPYRLATSQYLARAGSLWRTLRAAAKGWGGPGDPASAGADGENLSILELRLPRSVAPGKASFVWGE